MSVINGGLPWAKKEGVKLETGPPKQFEVSKSGTVTNADKVTDISRKLNIQSRLWSVMLLSVRNALTSPFKQN